MKSIRLYIFASLLVLSNLAFSQSEGGTPFSFDHPLRSLQVKGYELKAPNLTDQRNQDKDRDKNGDYYRIGQSIETEIDFIKEGTWDTLENGNRICRMMISSEGAQALGLYYNQFWLPFGTSLFVYDQKQKQLVGAFTSENNNESGLFATEMILGESLILEYNEEARVTEKAQIKLSEVAYIYRGVEAFAESYNTSSSCHVNVNCSEGDNWQDQKRGVARILLKEGNQYGWCTGSLVNNARQDFEPYFLTADHCGQNATPSDYNQWIFYFNFEANGCSNPVSTPSYNTITGCQKVSNGGNAGVSGSDFKLLLFNSAVPLAYNVFFNGWSSANVVSNTGVCIHHPAGDTKKISTYNTSLITAGWNGSQYNSHWRVYWVNTANGFGVTEGGSSGAPLFDSLGNIVGTLTGGGATCTNSYLPDYFGKFSYSWESNGTLASNHLREWLDPDSLGITALQGVEHEIALVGVEHNYCLSDSAVVMQGIPANGQFWGLGVSGSVFDPAQAGVGNHYIFYSSSAGAISFQINVHPNPTLDLGPDLTLPAGQTANIAAPMGHPFYTWSTGDSTYLMSTTQAGMYSLTVEDAYGCKANDEVLLSFSSSSVDTQIVELKQGWGIMSSYIDPINQSMDSVFAPVLSDVVIVKNGAGDVFWPPFINIIGDFNTGEGYQVNMSQNRQLEVVGDAVSPDNSPVLVPQGWSLIGYLRNTPGNATQMLNDLDPMLVIVKNGDGWVYWPPYVNDIGNLKPGEGYQVKLSSPGTLTYPSNTPNSVSNQ